MPQDRLDCVESKITAPPESDKPAVSLSDMKDFFANTANKLLDSASSVLNELPDLTLFDSAADFKPLASASDSVAAKKQGGDKQASTGAPEAESTKKYDIARDKEVMLDDGDTSSFDAQGVQHVTRKDGTRVSAWPDGFRITETPEGQHIQRSPDGSIYSTDRSSGARTWEDPQGNKRTEFPTPQGPIVETETTDGQIHTEYPNGDVIDDDKTSIRTRKVDGTLTVENKQNGESVTYLTDGTSVRMSKNDDAIVTTHPDGRIETADGKGVTTILDPNDGSVTVRDDKSGETTVFQRNGSWSTRDRNDKVISSGVTSDSEEPHL